MSSYIKRAEDWLNAHPKAKEWSWFIALWCGGFLTVAAAAQFIKFLINMAR